ncbi:MAG: sulfite exporter TauE/SafE family protein [Elusimicrobia bacterium]|nr:sulfite exporter TauE/SafE family protein [Elusimicrobiota bacterium]
MTLIFCVVLGLAAGVLSGLMGIGGGLILIPALIFLFGFSQHQAQGTTLALMVPPIGILAAWTYYKHGFVDLKIAAFICIGFIIGGLFGAQWAITIPKEILRRIFGIIFLLISLHMIFTK